MTFDFTELMGRLELLVGRRMQVLYVGVLADERVPLPPEARAFGTRIRWVGRLTRIRCKPDLNECKRFCLRPQSLNLHFDRGVRLMLELEHIVGFRPRGKGLHIFLRKGLSLLFAPIN